MADLSNNTKRFLKKSAKRIVREIRKLQCVSLHLTTPPNVFQIDFCQRDEAAQQILALLKDTSLPMPASTIADYYYSAPLDEKAIVMIGLGKNVRGNLQYILNELNYSEDFEGYKIYVRTVDETDEIVKNYIAQNNWTRTIPLMNDSEYDRAMESSKYMLTEVFFSESWIKRPRQVYINIWHGTPLKKLGLAKHFKNRHKSGTVQRNFIETDYLVYPNDYTRINMLESYGISQLLNGQILMNGYPRTGGMLQAAQEDQSELRHKLAPNGERLYAYMPTFRDYISVEESTRQSQELLDYLDAHLQNDQLLYVNLHHKFSDAICYDHFRHIRRFPADVDSYRLLSLTDALISDYSSVFFDYLALRRQIILYINDYELYCQKRGVYMNLLELPFDKAMTPAEVFEALQRGKTYDDSEVFSSFCAYDSAQSAHRLCQLFLGHTEAFKSEPIEKSEKKKILIYSEGFGPVNGTKLLLKLTRAYDRTASEIYLSCDVSSTDANKSSAYPLLFENTVIGTEKDTHLSAAGKAALSLYQNGMISFDRAMEYLKYDYSLVLFRMYGRCKFDTVVLYDIDNPEKLLALAQADANKLLFLPKHVLEKAMNGDSFLKDALIYAADFCSGIFTESKETKKTAQELFASDYEIQIASTAEAIEKLLLAKC